MRRKNSSYNLISVVLGLIMFLLTRKLVVNALVEDTQINYSDLDLKIERDDSGYSQIKTYHADKLISETVDTYSHAQPSHSEENIVWMSQIDSYWQIFLQNIPSQKTIQITHYGNNVNPFISGNKIAWERLEDGVWQIYLFDDYKLRRLTTTSSTKQIIDFTANKILFHQKTVDNKGWELYIYDLLKDAPILISDDLYTSTPVLRGNLITWVGTSADDMSYNYEYNLLSGAKNIEEITNIRIENFDAPQPPEELRATVPEPVKIEKVDIEDIYEELELVEDVEESTVSEDMNDDIPLEPTDVSESTESQI